MPEVMRLNRTVYCDGCGTMVNPYIVERKLGKDLELDKQNDSYTLECPSCEHTWKQKDQDE
jgi:hypothetical protein